MEDMRKRKLPKGMWVRNGVYYARFRANGREVRKRLSTDYKAACTLLNDMRARADKADFNLLDNDYSYGELKKEFLEWVNQTRRRPKEYERHFKTVEQFRKINNVRELNHSFIVAFRESRIEEGVSARTINIEVGTVQNMLNRGVEWGRVGSNPIEGVKPLRHDKPKKQRRPLTSDEVRSVLKHSPEYLKPVWRTFMATGVRRTELISLRFQDIDFERGVVIVRAEFAKNGKEREIPVGDGTLAMLSELREKATCRRPVAATTMKRTQQQADRFTADHVFVTKVNTPLRNNLLTRFYAICKKAGIKDAKPGGSVDIHSLRVSFTTLAIDGGASPKAVQEILGHSTLDLTMRVYAKATETAKRQAVRHMQF